MLAEPKRKIKWSPNPCGNLWAKDTSKFGQKILEKFGWTAGKGLGVNEQGITAPVRLKCNSTQKGLGYERGNKLECFQHQLQFDSILSELSSTSDAPSVKETCVSLEQASKNCRTRVHYHKFTRGKDLSRYSEKDLSCILGAFAAFDDKLPSKQENNQLLNEFEQLDSPDAEDGFENSKQTSMKIENLKSNSKKKRKRKYNDDYNANISHDSSHAINITEEIESCEISITLDKDESQNRIHKSKKRIKLSESTISCKEQQLNENEICEISSSSKKDSKKKKRKNKSKNCDN